MMRFPKWRRQKQKNLFETSMTLDNPDIKIVKAEYDKKLAFFAVGTSKQRELKVAGKGSTEGIGAEYSTQKDLDWKIYWNRKVLPDFIPIEKLEQLMIGTASVSSGSSISLAKTTFEKAEIELMRELLKQYKEGKLPI